MFELERLIVDLNSFFNFNVCVLYRYSKRSAASRLLNETTKQSRSDDAARPDESTTPTKRY